jgi:hypothetical protein
MNFVSTGTLYLIVIKASSQRAPARRLKPSCEALVVS